MVRVKVLTKIQENNSNSFFQHRISKADVAFDIYFPNCEINIEHKLILKNLFLYSYHM